MNMQAHMSGQISGQVPNQAGTQLHGLSQQHGNSLPSQVHNLGGHRITGGMDTEILKARRYMQEKIYEFLKQRHHQTHDIQPKKVLDIVRRLEEGLFKGAMSQDYVNLQEYMNLETLENRLHAFIKRQPMSNHNQYPQHVNSSSSIGKMIPTPGMSLSGNLNLTVTSSLDTSMVAASGGNNLAPTTVNTGSFLATSNGLSVGIRSNSSNPADGFVSNCYQQSPSFSIGSGGNNLTSIGVQRIASQMIPTPGFNNNNDLSYMNLASSNNAAGFSSVDSTMLSTQHQQKQHVSGHNSHIFHLGSQMGGGTRSGLQQKSYGFTNESLNGGLGMIGNNLQNVSGPGTSEGYLSSSPYLSSSKPLQHFDQHQRHLSQGDGYGINSGDPTGSASGTFYGSLATTGSVINTHNLSHVSLQSMAKASSSLMSNQSNLYSTQQAEHIKSHIVDQPDKVNFVPPLSSRENILQSQQQNFHQQPLQFQQQQQFVQHQRLQRQQSHQNLLLAKNDAFSQPQVVANQGSQVKPVPGVDYHNEVLSSQVPEQFQLSVSQNQFQQNFTDDRCRGSHLLSHASGPQADVPSLSQTSQQIEQILHQHQFVAGPQIDSSHLSSGTHSEPILQSQWHPRSQNQSQVATNLSHGQHVQEEFRQRMSGQDDAQRNNLSSEGSITQTTASRSTLGPLSSPGVSCRPGNVDREQQFKNQQRWLLFLCHARRCAAPEGKCQEPNCVNAQNLLKHLDTCTQSPAECAYPRCRLTKILLNHYKYCYESKCPVCMPVRSFIQLVRARRKDSSVPNSINGSCKSNDTAETSARLISKALSIETPENVHPSLKRIKMEQPSLPLLSESESPIVAFSTNEGHIPHALPHQGYQNSGACVPVKSEITEEKMEVSASYTQGFSCGSEAKRDNIDDAPNQKSNGHLIKSDEPDSFMNQGDVGPAMEVDRVKQENEQSIEQATGTKSGKPKIKGVSLTELFTPEQVREHIMGLRQWVGQSKAKAEKNQAMEHSMSENSCQLCAVEKLTFEPPPIYCTPCGVRIKRNAMYYTVGTGDTRHYFCIPCYNEARGDTIVVDGTTIPKARLEKKKNDEETEEWWVQCDKCEAWQHQICALFNGRRNDGGQAEYTCPNCYIAEVERGERKPLPQSAVLGAKDLPRTILSDHLEQRLFRRLKQERQDRARLQGKSYDEVPGAESLVVRVVSSVDKKLEVKPRFLEIFQEEGYPTEFPYKSKVVLLFQKIEGVEVCLFGMYVQEFGSESLFPNQRRVYLSYLDSVKYFRPEVKAVTGEALRTFVYHEILTGYLEYCKRRGFTSCYIWACPPLKGEDYILYCHPEIQKTPKSDKLREWYLSMLRKAAKENIVVDLTNLYDHFFVSTGECKAKVTAARLPYFDGDYWPGAAEDIIYQIRQEEDGRKQSKKGAMKKTLTKRALKASGQSDLSGNASKDLLLMHRLGETISPMKEDFIMVHLQHSCTHCCILMVSGNCWVCNQCKNFQICQKCYEIEQKREERERHPTNHREKHVLYPVEIPTVPEDTKDKDEILESEFFDTRQAFLSLCQGNHYQYDTLRRAKHSSMMVLYHLHNPTAPAFVTTCNACHLDIESGQGWRCEVCPDYDVCNSCYQKDGGIDHPHKLTNHPSLVDRDAQNKEARQLRFQQLRKMLDLLVHASQCRSAQCQYPNCRKVKGLFRHGMQCKTRASGGCVLCKKMWYLLHLHARACKESECHVPRCRDLKEHLRRLQQQSDSRRRAAVNEMMRQRAAELAGNAG